MRFLQKSTQFCGLGSILERIGGAARDHTALNRTQNGLSNSKKSPANPGHIVDGGGKAFPESAKFDRILHFPEYENGLEMVDPVMAVGIFRYKMFSGDPSIKIKWVAHCGFQKKEIFLMNYYQYSKLQNSMEFCT